MTDPTYAFRTSLHAHDLDEGGHDSHSGVIDKLTGDSSLFEATNGSWTNSGGTLTWSNNSNYFIFGGSGSLKHVTTANNQYVEIPIAGTFLAGHVYDAFVWVAVEENSFGSVDQLSMRFGLIGTDELGSNPGADLVAGQFWVNGNGVYLPIYARWSPSADRTGVKLRLTRALIVGSGTVSTHIGHARVAEVMGTGSLGLSVVMGPYPAENPNVQYLFLNQPAGIAAGPFTNLISFDGSGLTISSPYFTTSLKFDEARMTFASSSGGLVLPQLSGDPSSPVEGETYMNTTTHKVRTYDGTAWQNHW